nr:unnamed protein product [Callosobruchus analis]
MRRRWKELTMMKF